jgi:trafficking protein particle complex subunit 10
MESWIYSACLNTVAQCDRAFAVVKQGSASGAAFIAHYAAVKGELVELARHQVCQLFYPLFRICFLTQRPVLTSSRNQQLDKIGVHLGHLTATPPFSLSLPSTFTTPRFANGETLNSKITRPELVEVLGQ